MEVDPALPIDLVIGVVDVDHVPPYPYLFYSMIPWTRKH